MNENQVDIKIPDCVKCKTIPGFKERRCLYDCKNGTCYRDGELLYHYSDGTWYCGQCDPYVVRPVNQRGNKFARWLINEHMPGVELEEPMDTHSVYEDPGQKLHCFQCGDLVCEDVNENVFAPDGFWSKGWCCICSETILCHECSVRDP